MDAEKLKVVCYTKNHDDRSAGRDFDFDGISDANTCL